VLPAFVITLREGLEAALIVSIVSAFLIKNGQASALRWVALGTALAAGICLLAGVVLHLVEQSLPQKQQEGLETIVSLTAVAMVTYMIVWMRRNARSLRRSLELSTGEALARGSVMALVLMAFFAVFREGLETAVFLVAAFQNSVDPTATGSGAILGLVAAVVLGYALYRGGLRIDLGRFFRLTGLVLVVVAAGLVASALHTAHEAGWVNFLQDEALNLDWLVRPGTVISALVTGMFGIQARPTVVEVLGWLAYLVPVGLYVAWPQGRPAPPPRASGRDTVPLAGPAS
jgi:high-affinity iron transporter